MKRTGVTVERIFCLRALILVPFSIEYMDDEASGSLEAA